MYQIPLYVNTRVLFIPTGLAFSLQPLDCGPFKELRYPLEDVESNKLQNIDIHT